MKIFLFILLRWWLEICWFYISTWMRIHMNIIWACDIWWWVYCSYIWMVYTLISLIVNDIYIYALRCCFRLVDFMTWIYMYMWNRLMFIHDEYLIIVYMTYLSILEQYMCSYFLYVECISHPPVVVGRLHPCSVDL